MKGLSTEFSSALCGVNCPGIGVTICGVANIPVVHILKDCAGGLRGKILLQLTALFRSQNTSVGHLTRHRNTSEHF